MRKVPVVLALAAVVLTAPPVGATNVTPTPLRTLDGSANNAAHPTWGQAGSLYLRLGPTSYADGVGAVPTGLPDIRNLSNRIFNDVGQNLFSENGVTQWGWAWGQFMDHDLGLRDESTGDGPALPFTASDPLEQFHDDLGVIDFSRTRPAPGTGIAGVPRQHVNTLSSYIDGSGIYGVSAARLDWLRTGPLDGDPANNLASLLLTSGGYLPRVTARGNAAAAPPVDLMGALMGTPDRAAVAGDVRANENIALTALHTLFAREHNRIVTQLPSSLTQEQKFQIARRVIGAELQYITYTEFLPALGVRLPAYRGYNRNVNAGLSQEFAVVGYRAHSMIHGEFEPVVPAGRYSDAQLATFRSEGVTVEVNGDGTLTLVIPLSLAFGNPDLLEQVGLNEVLSSLTDRQYKNDEQIDNSLRSVLFQVPKPGIPDPTVCGSPVISPDCFSGVSDLGAIDVARDRDHGIGSYNALRVAYGLSLKTSFAAITGESSEVLPAGSTIDTPSILDFVQLRDGAGNVLTPGTEEANEDAVVGIRRSTLAARLKAVYGSVSRVDAFAGMVSEKHVPGTEFGELQLAIWKRQFQAVRDGDRFFYLNDPALPAIQRALGISYRHSLADIIKLNTGLVTQPNVFRVAG